MSLPRTLLAALVAAFSMLATPAFAGVVAPPANFQSFAPDSLINTPLRDDAPIHARSAEWVNWMVTDPTYGVGSPGHVGYFNASGCNMPTYWASTDTPRVEVKMDPNRYQDQAMIAAWKSVPYDYATMPSADCSDANIAVLEEQPDGTVDEWEWWKLKKGTWACAAGTTCSVGSSANWVFTEDEVNGQLYAAFGGATQDIQNDRGFASYQQWTGNPNDPIFTARKAAWNMNVTATGMNVTAGVVTLEDVAQGEIDHLVGLATPESLKGSYLWPAQRYDGGLTETETRKPLPEGARMRIPADFDLDAYFAANNAPALVQMVARAAQKYGIFVRDRTWSSYSFYGEHVPDGMTNPYTAALEGQTNYGAFTDKFPWEELVVLDAPMCTGVSGSGCRPGAAQHVDIQLDDQVATVGEPLTLDTRNSLLEFPRTQVEVDVDGDGVYEVDADQDVKPVVTPSSAGQRTISVRVTQRGGTVLTGTVEVDVAPAEEPPPACEPEVLEPDSEYGGNGQFFASDSGTLLHAVTTTGIYAYHRASGAKVTYDIADPVCEDVDTATVKAYVDSSAKLNVEVQALTADGVYMGSGTVPFGTSGWVEFNVTGDLAGMRIRAVGTSLTGWAWQTDIGKVRTITVTTTP